MTIDHPLSSCSSIFEVSVSLFYLTISTTISVPTGDRFSNKAIMCRFLNISICCAKKRTLLLYAEISFSQLLLDKRLYSVSNSIYCQHSQYRPRIYYLYKDIYMILSEQVVNSLIIMRFYRGL